MVINWNWKQINLKEIDYGVVVYMISQEEVFFYIHYLLILLLDQHLKLTNGTLLGLRQLEIQLELGLMEFNVLI